MFGFSLEPYSPLLYIQLTPYIENMLKRLRCGQRLLSVGPAAKLMWSHSRSPSRIKTIFTKLMFWRISWCKIPVHLYILNSIPCLVSTSPPTGTYSEFVVLYMHLSRVHLSPSAIRVTSCAVWQGNEHVCLVFSESEWNTNRWTFWSKVCVRDTKIGCSYAVVKRQLELSCLIQARKNWVAKAAATCVVGPVSTGSLPFGEVFIVEPCLLKFASSKLNL